MLKHVRRWAGFWMGMGAVLLAGPVGASDGVLEINQACALVGCFPGDGAGFPVTLSESGSYRLTSDLEYRVDVFGQNAPAIDITAPNVTLDLGGFSVLCSRPISPLTLCGTQPRSGGKGITGDDDNVTVRNGRVIGMANDGVDLGSGSVVEDVRSVDNAGDGIRVDSDGRIERCQALDNGDRGVVVGAHSVLNENLAQGNASDGFAASVGSNVRGNVAYDNEGDGFDLGVFSGSHSALGGLAADNTASANTGLGLRLEPAWGYHGNALNLNNGGNFNAQASGGVNLGQNACGTGLCP